MNDAQIKSAEDFPTIDIDTVGVTEVKGADGKTVTVVWPFALHDCGFFCSCMEGVRAGSGKGDKHTDRY